MNCIICLTPATIVFCGSTYCEKHYIEKKQKLEVWNKTYMRLLESEDKLNKETNEIFNKLLEE